MTNRLSRVASLVAVGVFATTSLSCTSGQDRDVLRILAASSLTEVFEALAVTFENAHPGVDVRLSFGSSTDLAGQAADGAPGAVLATADEQSMAIARDAGVVAAPAAFAGNVIVLATPTNNPRGIRGLADLVGTAWVRCADDVPCGRAASAVLADAGVDDEPVSLEEDARATLDKVLAGEADAALVYRTDAIAAADQVTTLSLPGAEDFPATYLIAPLSQAPDDALADEFVDLVLGAGGRTVLDEAGFVEPPVTP